MLPRYFFILVHFISLFFFIVKLLILFLASMIKSLIFYGLPATSVSPVKSELTILLSLPNSLYIFPSLKSQLPISFSSMLTSSDHVAIKLVLSITQLRYMDRHIVISKHLGAFRDKHILLFS